MSTRSFRTPKGSRHSQNLITLLRRAQTRAHTGPQCSCPVVRQGQSAAQPPVSLRHHLAGVGIDALARHQASRWVGADRSAEEQDVRLRPGGGRCGGRLRACGRVAHATGEGGMRRQALSARPGGAWHKGVVSRPVAGTCGWNSAPIRGFAARRCRATPYQSAGAPWAQSWQCAWARSRDCAASERVN